jgi:serine/threonine-protein kinase
MSLPNNSKRKIFDGRYEILSIVGRGADSVVYRGRHISGTQQEVAIKVLINRDGSSTLTDKLRREALTLVSCRHRYVVRLDDFHSIKDLCYLSMEYAQKGDLGQFLSELPNNKLPANTVGLFLKQCLEGLDFVHATGVVHRDIKPENILVLNEKEIRLADFGLALLPGDEVQLDELRNAVGSFDYLAPEVLQGVRYDAISDLYSLGVCFYEAATGLHPFADAPIAEKLKARNDNSIQSISELVPELEPQVAGVITTLMRYAAGERFHSAAEALRALDNSNYKPFVTKPLSTQVETELEAVGIVNSGGNIGSTELDSSDKALKKAGNVDSELGIDDLFDLDDVSDLDNFDIDKARDSDPSRSPANSDRMPERESPPTEKIDLERIKAIIARDTESKEAKINPTAQLNANPKKQEDLAYPIQRGAPATKSFAGGDSALSSLIFRRFLSISIAFAILTISGVYAYNTFFSGSSASLQQSDDQDANTSETGLPIDTDDDSSEDSLRNQDQGLGEDQSESKEQNSAGVNPNDLKSILRLPEGNHSGSFSGLFFGEGVPIVIISKPQQQQLVLMVAIDGWTPAIANLADLASNDTEELTFRSNGLILKLKQISADGEITGTLTDIVTGDTGTWKLFGTGS